MKATYHIEGMHCQSCERKVGEALRSAPGVQRAEVSLATGRATIEADDQVDRSLLEQRVAEAGNYRLSPPDEPHDAATTSSNGATNGAMPGSRSRDTEETSAVEHDAEAQKFLMHHEGRESSLRYSRPADGSIALEHTFVPPKDRNQGIAETLTRRALAYAEDHGLKVIPECAYVRNFIDEHEEFQSLVADQRSDEHESHAHEHADHDDAEQATWLATYWPLILTVAYLVGGTIVAGIASGNWSTMFLMSMFMGLFFVAFSFFKLLDLAGFAEAYSSYDLISARWFGYGYVYPFIELALGIAYLVQWWPVATNVVTLVVMIVGTIGVVNAVARGRDIQCGCLGTMFDLPMSTVTIVEDVSMAAMAGGMLVMLL